MDLYSVISFLPPPGAIAIRCVCLLVRLLVHIQTPAAIAGGRWAECGTPAALQVAGDERAWCRWRHF